MKTNYCILSVLCCLMAACTPSNNVGFTWSPDQPRAGQLVRFTNTSESGSEWEWDFGDNATSISKNPTHIYKRIGAYTVTLKVDGRRSWTHSEQVHIYDTIPAIACLDSHCDSTGVVDIFERYTFSAAVYNPYFHPLRYQWTIDSTTLAMLPDTLGRGSITVRIARPMDRFHLELDVLDTRTDSAWHTERDFVAQDVAAPAVVYTTDGPEVLFQRHYSVAPIYYEQLRETTNGDVIRLLETTQDTLGNYGNEAYDCAKVSAIVNEAVLGFTIRNGRIYYRTASALRVASMQGQNVVTIAEGDIHFVTCHVENALLYYATETGVYSLPLIQNYNNRFDASAIVEVNDRTDIRAIAFTTTKYLLRDLQ